MEIKNLVGVLGIGSILLISFLLSNNKKKINFKLITYSLILQTITGILILKNKVGQNIISFLAKCVTELLDISQEGSKFIFGFLANKELIESNITGAQGFIFIVQVVPTIIFICALASILYYFGILQVIVKLFASIFNKLLGVSGAEALANTTVAFVGQVESAIIIQPYLNKLTKSEILTIMTGGMACISGSLLAIYSSLGVQAEYLIAASCMAIPGSFLISKIIYPEDETPETKDLININIRPGEKNLIEAILDGAYSGAKISIGVISMLLAFISLVALLDKILFLINNSLSLKMILGYVFSPIIFLLGVPQNEVGLVAQLFGTKIALNEFIAYLDLSKLIENNQLSEKSIAISSFILCGFANFGSIAIQIGGLTQMAPERKSDFAELGLKAMVAGAFVSCISGCIVGILI